MHMLTRAAALMFVLVLAPTAGASAHHSEAPHFIQNQMIELTGVVERWEFINPHSLLFIWVGQGADRVLWRCEANSAISIRRLGVTPDTFKYGERVTVQAMPPRVQKNLCNLREAKLADGRVVNFRLQAAPPEDAPVTVQANTSIFGVWALAPRPGALAGTAIPARGAPIPALPGTISGVGVMNGPQWVELLNAMTPEGKRAMAAYDAYRDDPVHQCSPVSPVRVWGAGPVSITRDGNDRIVIQHEFMDARRVVYLNRATPPAGVPRATLGYSIGKWDGDTLVIDNSNYAPGVITQYVVNGAGKLTGLLHSDAYRVTERLRFNPETKLLEVKYTQADPKYHTGQLASGNLVFRTASAPLEKWNCKPEKT
jgi:hypothetical protein